MITPEERETVILYDHPESVVKITTTQKDVYEGFIKRLGKKNILFMEADDDNSVYYIKTKEDVMRKPYYISRVLNK